jgi:hypothetical protein
LLILLPIAIFLYITFFHEKSNEKFFDLSKNFDLSKTTSQIDKNKLLTEEESLDNEEIDDLVEETSSENNIDDLIRKINKNKYKIYYSNRKQEFNSLEDLLSLLDDYNQNDIKISMEKIFKESIQLIDNYVSDIRSRYNTFFKQYMEKVKKFSEKMPFNVIETDEIKDKIKEIELIKFNYAEQKRIFISSFAKLEQDIEENFTEDEDKPKIKQVFREIFHEMWIDGEIDKYDNMNLLDELKKEVDEYYDNLQNPKSLKEIINQIKKKDNNKILLLLTPNKKPDLKHLGRFQKMQNINQFFTKANSFLNTSNDISLRKIMAKFDFDTEFHKIFYMNQKMIQDQAKPMFSDTSVASYVHSGYPVQLQDPEVFVFVNGNFDGKNFYLYNVDSY